MASTAATIPVAYGSHQIVGTSNEDRGCSLTSKPADDNMLFASFGIFDGHYGQLAAAASAQHLHKNVQKRFNAFATRPAMVDTAIAASWRLTMQEKLDACFCEAMRISCFEMDENIRASDKSGTCVESVFCMHNPVDESIRVYFTNIGDSRTVLFGRKFTSIQDRMAMDASSHSELGQSEHDNELGVSEHDGRAPLPKAARVKANKLTKAFSVTEDHTLTLPREKLRIMNEVDRLSLSNYWNPLPAEVMGEVSLFDPKYQTNHIVKTTASAFIDTHNSLFDVGYPSFDKMSAAAELMGVITTDPEIADVATIKHTAYRTNGALESEVAVDYAIQHTDSFIGSRDPRIDKEFLFGRYNLSAMMTRTIGDKFGPRSCIPLPDISAITIKHNEFARIVMASDGMWDVLTVENVRKTVMKFRFAEDVAVALAQSASNLRASHGIRKDDITVIVVDINPTVYEELYKGNKCTIV